MFKPVTGEALNQYDEETRALFAKRQNDPRLTHTLLCLPRVKRNHLPIVANPEDPTVKEHAAYRASFPYKLMAGMMFFVFAGNQFSKAYFPYGIILRRSIPQTMAQQISHRAPVGLIFLTLWYMQREFPRSQRLDLTCDSEN